MTTITPFLWFDHQIDEALAFYLSVFPDARIDSKQTGPDGNTFGATFTLQGQTFHALNGGPGHPFTDAVSMFVQVADQAEIDRYWAALTADGGQEGPCGWCQDKFGLSWQVVPRQLGELMGGSGPEAGARVGEALRSMGKLDLAALQRAATGG